MLGFGGDKKKQENKKLQEDIEEIRKALVGADKKTQKEDIEKLEKKGKKAIKEIKKEMIKEDYPPEVIDAACHALARTGIWKKDSKILGTRLYKSPIIMFIHDDGEVEVIEDAKAGIFNMNIEGENSRYVLEPRKLLSLPSPVKDQDLKGWILSESEAQAYPVDVVQDAAQFDNICKEFEAVQEFEDWKKGGFWKWLTPQMFFMIIIGVVILLAVLSNYGPQIFGTAQQTLNNTPNMTNVTINMTPQINVIP